MKSVKLLTAIALATTPALVAQGRTYVPREGEIQFKVLQTTKDKPLHEITTNPFTVHRYSLLRTIDLDTARPSHDYFGIGVSMTDASCYLLSTLDPEKRHSVLKKAFTKNGLNISMVRLNCGASDYATELYNYNDEKDDVKMEHFSVARDELYMIPMLKMLPQYCTTLFTYAAVWSVPGWMKDSGEMCGGSLLDKYMPAFANYWAAYIKAYKQHGINIEAISVQNEPSTDQRGGCPATLVSAKQEAELIAKHLPAAFKAAGVSPKIWCWDHDYIGYERVIEVLNDKRAKRNTDAVAWHPYSGKPEMMQEVLKQHPGMTMHLTERGPSYAMIDKQTEKWWADYVFGALNNGCSSFSSWNLILDTDGQPCTGRFFCGGLFVLDTETGKVTESRQATLFRQFSPYVKRGAKIMAIEQPDKDITTIAFRNPDGQYVVVVAADEKPKTRQRVQIKFKGQYFTLNLPLHSWSLSTIIIDKQ